MVIFMAGFPFSGKSVIARKLSEEIPYINTHIDPKTYRPDDYESMNAVSKSETNISVWAVSLEVLQEQIKENDDSAILIYDTACANREKMLPVFLKAKQLKHHVVFCYVKANIEVCEKRAEKEWFGQDVIDKYTRSFEENTPLFARQADKVFVIENNGDDPPDVSKVIEHIVKHYERED